MAEYSAFFDSTAEDQRIYQSADWAEYMQQVIGGLEARDAIGTGVSRYGYEGVNNLLVSVSGSNMNSIVGAGAAFINGRFYKNTDPLSLTHDVADPTNDRIDTIVLRLDLSVNARYIRAFVKKGVPAASPNPPGITVNDTIKEIQIAQVRISAGVSFIASGSVTDTRADETVCGYLPLHNFYRGQKIDSRGIVTLPNQSYVEVNDQDSFNTPAGEGRLSQTLALNPIIDRQNEVAADRFTPKASGTYFFSCLVSLLGGLVDTQELEVYLVINNQTEISDRVYLFSRPGISSIDNNFFGSNVKYLNAGDVVEMRIATNNITVPIATAYHRVSVAKLN
ncbi:hypothetical protein [Jeotgalibacillus haloalkalitolerans]|uniref:C1q domain-containing protein n=1 Tax=Jeotgalibacillus haloalkalitolerans TaxID=3104292 RepID=A0ABU5KK79_9BACL|nr:hypothetical protein [Jeotgalibacillus sp. HH7-29]MDZ5711667.1 hypothetical protein [Jeotgalibacillus sp. HH7-29]